MASDETGASERASTLGRDDKGDKGKGGGSEEKEKPGNGKPEAGDSGKPEKTFHGSLSGFVTAVSGTSITVRGITVTPAPGAIIRHGNRILDFTGIVVGNHVQAKGTMTQGALLASEIKVEETKREDGDDNERSGTISGLAATTGCPVLTFVIGTTTIRTSSTTVFEDVLCSALANGAVVEVSGVLQTDGSILATKVELEDDEDDAKVEGQVSGLSSIASCPVVSFTIGTKQITTSASTTFEDVTCAALVNGLDVEVKGVVQSNGSILATKVERD
ncbi:MAG: hypothetical protein HOP16_14970 [Acidobacteria bacterium]|nr:hypothetical protein [Acidobacteriota bacterium]